MSPAKKFTTLASTLLLTACANMHSPLQQFQKPVVQPGFGKTPQTFAKDQQACQQEVQAFVAQQKQQENSTLGDYGKSAAIGGIGGGGLGALMGGKSRGKSALYGGGIGIIAGLGYEYAKKNFGPTPEENAYNTCMQRKGNTLSYQ